MIDEHSFRALLPSLGFTADASGNIFFKRFNSAAGSLFACEMRADFVKKALVYPEDSGLKVNERQTCNFLAPENFVVFECVHRLLAQGYQPAHIELEHPVTIGHGASGGRLDIWVKDNDGNSLLIIECKTAGKAFEDAWKATQEDGDQLFSYANALDSKTPFVALYASDWNGSKIVADYRLISLQDNTEFLKSLPKDALAFQTAATTKERFRAWKETYQQDFTTRGLFESDIAAYTIGKTKYSSRDLKEVDGLEIQKKYHTFATILRKHNVASKENAFDKLVNLFLAKIVDENKNPDELKFYWRGAAYDDVKSLIDRLQRLYKTGMEEFLKVEVTYVEKSQIDDAFRLFKKDATKRTILEYFDQLKYYTNNEFAFINVHNEKLFHQNAAVLLEIVRMLQDIRLQTEESHQFLGDLFEGFLDQGVKQSEGQFFTPTPIVRFLVSSLPLEKRITETPKPPRVIDYACGAGHFLNEYCHRIFPFIRKKHSQKLEEGVERIPDKETFQKYYAAVTGIEKEYRLSKVSKVSASMYGQDDIRIIYADALAAHPDVADGSFDVLIANPPYSVKGFLETLSGVDRARYEIFSAADDIAKNNSIECFFVERAKQLLAPGGVAAIILPSSILSNTGIYTRMREILLKYFDIVAIAEFGSGTFGKTGTNTATLFLRRKAGKPDLAEHYQNRVDDWFEGDFSKDDEFEDTHLLAAWCAKIGVPPDDYKTLLAGKPNTALLDAGIFKEYRKAFDNSTEAKNIQKKKLTAKYTESIRAVEREKAWLDFLRTIEGDKLYTFMLAADNLLPVVLVKIPAGTKATKQFLGYSWSTRKGNEGIKYLAKGTVISEKDETADNDNAESVDDKEDKRIIGNLSNVNNIETPLYNPVNLADSEKINTLIRAAFNGETPPIPASLSAFVTRAALVDMLDFTRPAFDKAFKTSPETKTEITSKWPLQSVSSLVEIISGGTPDTDTAAYWDGDIPWLSVADFSSELRFVSKAEKTITQAGLENSNTQLLQPGDIIISARGTVGAMAQLTRPMAFNQSCYGLRSKGEISNAYVFYVLGHYIQQLQAKATGTKFAAIIRKTFDEVKIPVPTDKTTQHRIVSECEAVDADSEAARKTIEEAQARIAKMFDGLEKRMKQMKIGDAPLVINDLNTNPNETPNAEFIYIDIDAVENGIGQFSTDKRITGATAPSRARRLAKGKSVLISTVRPNLKGFAYLASEIPNAVFSTGFAILRSSDEAQLSGKFVYLCFMHLPDLMTQMEKAMPKGQYPSINKTDIENLQIPVPSPAEQTRIIAEVEQHESTITTARATLAAAPARKRAILEKWLRKEEDRL